MKIKHQMQPDGVTCTSACLAMLLNKPVSEVVEEFHADYSFNKTRPHLYLAENGLEVKRCFSDESILPGDLYLVTVPSLTIEGSLHHILIDIREDTPVIYDPNMGRKDMRYYIPWTQDVTNSLEVQAKKMIPDVMVITDTNW